jgi:hypothetical protein
MTAVKHMARRKPGESPATAPAQHRRNSQLREQFPPRPAQPWWPETAQDQEAALRRLTSPPFTPEGGSARAARRRGTAKILRWLASFPGDTWQQRWEASGVEAGLGASWVELPLAWFGEHGEKASCDAGDLSSGLLMLACGDVIRPGLAWMLTRPNHHLAVVMAETRDPAGFARLRELAEAGPDAALKDARLAATRIATLLACKGGVISDITVGDCVEMADTQRRVQARGGQKKVDFYLRLHALGIFPGDAPATIRAFGMAQGELTIEELVDRYRLQCKPVRDLLVDYLDLQTLKRTVAGPDGQKTVVTRPRLNAKNELIRVRAFYLDIAQWATEEPGRWAQWAVPSPVSDAEISWAKERRRRKARMDQRTRERLPVLPVLTRTAADRKTATARRLQAARATPPGEIIEGTGGTLRRAVAPKASGKHVWAEDTATGKRRNLSYEEEEAFWAFATIEVLRLTGIRCEELLELTHHSITEYRLPTTGELVPLLQIAPSKTDTERLLPGQPRARGRAAGDHQQGPRAWRRRPADRLLRRPGTGLEPADAAAVPAVHRQRDPGIHPQRDPQPAHQRPRRDRPHRRRRRPAHVLPARFPKNSLCFVSVWRRPRRTCKRNSDLCHPATSSSLPLVAERRETGARSDSPANCNTNSLHTASADRSHIFVTDAIMSGLPPHIAQVICGHKTIGTTIGYKAVYPAEAIEAHRAFIARRRATRPSEEYRTPTEEEWDAFLAHFEKRKVSVGTCARAFASPCVHEHVRCSLLRPDPAQRGRLEEIRASLHDRIAEAEREGWLGEIEGLKVSLAGTEDKLAQIDTALRRREQAVHLGMPAFPDIAGRSVPPAPGGNP